MKIGYVCSDFDIPLFGHEGCSVRIREFTNALVEEGHDVFLMCSDLGERTKATLEARLYEVGPSGLDRMAFDLLHEDLIEGQNLDRDLRLVLHNLWLRGDCDAIIQREKPDVLYEVYALFGYGGIALARRFGIPHILEVNAPLCMEQAGYDRFTLTGTAQLMEDAIYCASDAVVTVSDWLREYVVSRGVEASRARVVANGVADRLFGVVASGDAVREEFGLAQKHIVGFVGTFQPWHDLDVLFEAVSALSERDPDLRLLLVGDGPERRAAEETVARLGLANIVVFCGAVLHERVPEFIAAMDVAVSPLVWSEDHLYGSPMKLFEYMAAARPSVTTSIEQTTEIIEHGKTGWLCRPGDAHELAEGIATFLYTPGLGRTVGAAARERIMSEFTWRALARGVVSLADELVAHGAHLGKASGKAEQR